MKILFITLNQYQQGTYFRAYGFAKKLSKLGHQITLMSTSRNKKFGYEEFTESPNLLQVLTPDLFSGMLRSGWDLWNIFHRISWLKDKDFDLVHAFESRPSVIYPSLFMARKKIPIIMDWADWFGRGGSVEERQNPLIRKVLLPVETFYEEHFRNRAKGSTVICSELKNKLIKLGIDEKTILYLPNGVEKRLDLPIDKQIARERTGIDEHIPLIGWLGATFYQDAKLMAKAFNDLLIILPRIHLLIVGNFNQEIKTLVSHPDQIIYTGFINQEKLDLFLSSVDIFWLPMNDSNANRGRFPYKLTQYMLYQKPIIASPVGDIPRIFEKGDIGELVPSLPEKYAEATFELFKDYASAKIKGQNAKRIVEKDFLWDQLADELEQFYFQKLS